MPAILVAIFIFSLIAFSISQTRELSLERKKYNKLIQSVEKLNNHEVDYLQVVTNDDNHEKEIVEIKFDPSLTAADSM